MDPCIDGLETYKRIIEVQKIGAGKYIKKPYTFEKIGFVVRTELDN